MPIRVLSSLSRPCCYLSWLLFVLPAWCDDERIITIQLENRTNGAWPDDKIFWAVTANDPATGSALRLDVGTSADADAQKTGTKPTLDSTDRLVPMRETDAGHPSDPAFANYFVSLAKKKAFKLQHADSARIWISLGTPAFIKPVKRIDGKIGYAGPNLENPSDPNQPIVFDFAEFALNPHGLFANTTRVDSFGFPLKLHVKGDEGFDLALGETLTESRAELFQRFRAETPAEFHQLIKLAGDQEPPLRIVSPGHHVAFHAGGECQDYFAPYIDEVWNKCKETELVVDHLDFQFRGRVDNQNQFVFAGSKLVNGKRQALGEFYIAEKPTTRDVLLCDRVFNDPQKQSGDKIALQLMLQTKMSAALNRGVALQPADWNRPETYYQGKITNHYAAFWHRHSLKQKAYGFAYDDVADQSTLIHAPKPKEMRVNIGW